MMVTVGPLYGLQSNMEAMEFLPQKSIEFHFTSLTETNGT